MVARTRLLDRLRALIGLYFLVWLAWGMMNLPGLLGGRPLPFPGPCPGILALARWLFPALAVLMLGLALATERQRHARAASAMREGKTMLLLPRADLQAAKQISLWARVADVIPRGAWVSWEVSGGPDGIAFAVRAPEEVFRTYVTQIMAEWPGSRLQAAEDPVSVPEGRAAWQVEVAPASAERPIEPSVPDPLLAFLTEAARLPEGVRGGLQVLVRGDPVTRRRLGGKAARQSAGARRAESLEQKRAVKGLDERAQHLFLECRLIVWATAGTEEMARSVARSLARTLRAQFGPSNPLEQVAEGPGVPAGRDFPLFAGKPWADNELAAVAHLVGKEGLGVAPQLRTAPARPLPPSPACRVPRDARVVVRIGA